MVIIYSNRFISELRTVLEFISKDKRDASKSFNIELRAKIQNIKDNPKIYKKSQSFNNENYRDLTYKGYTIPYFIGKNEILILGIFKHNI